MPQQEGSPVEEGRPSLGPKIRIVPDLPAEIVPDLSLPGRAVNELTPLDEELLNALIESADYGGKPRRSPEDPARGLALAPPEEIVDAFRSVWDALDSELGLGVPAEDALEEVRDLVVYDIPDGTRSTLTVPPMMDVDLDAGMYCLALIHTLKSLGARDAVLMTHTVYNRARGPDDTDRFLKVVARAVEPVAQYARRHRVSVRLVGHGPGYELEAALRAKFAEVEGAPFRTHFLVDYAEEMFLTPEGREALEALPIIDVCVRHTKLQVSGGWIPTRMLQSSYVYCQNGTLFSNWEPEEYAALAAVALLSKKLMSGEVLSKSYLDIDDVKRRYQLRELNLFQKTVRLRPDPRKLFVVGSPIGLYQVYY
ncbi:MAG: hypothetical protein A3K65_01600 [Euryarchaeota archaeon RBG_16_68_12]|nr:MAG: hypothetical protein A3K65_01600 [Euryarchaeota archaeon RBG_16_68_12]